MKKRSAFTIIELLIVIAIIGLLAALVAAGVSSVRNAAREKHCTNNLRQLLDGALAFAMDHSQDMPHAQSYELYDQNTGTYSKRDGWCAWVNDKRDYDEIEALWQGEGCKSSHSHELADDRGLGADARFAVEYGEMFPYVGDFSAYACPVIQRAIVPPTNWEDDDGDKVKDTGIVRTYAMNPYFRAASNRSWRRVKTTWVGVTQGYGGHVPEASKLVVFAEVDGFGQSQKRNGFKDSTYGKDYSGSSCLNPQKSVWDANDQQLACWHSRLDPTEENRAKHPEEFFAQAIFFDGHVERLPATVALRNESGEAQNRKLNTAWLVTRGWDWTAERTKAPDE